MASHTVRTPEKPRLTALDGVRGWAAVIVMISHLSNFSHTIDFTDPLRAIVTNGGLAVFIFFIISGFALSMRFLRPAPPRASLQSSWLFVRLAIARWVRLVVPILAVCFIAYLLMSDAQMQNCRMKDFIPDKPWWCIHFNFIPSFVDFLRFSTFSAFFHYDTYTAYNTSLWTIPMEFGGSMIIFGLLVLLQTHLANKRIFAGITVALGIGLFAWQPALACFIIGYALAFLYTSPWADHALVKRLAPFAFIAAIIAWAAALPYNQQVFTIIGALVVAGVMFTPRLRTFFSNPLAQFLGRISFSLYLIHLLVICSVGVRMYVMLTGQGVAPTLVIALTSLYCAAIAILAAIILTPVDKYGIRLSHRVAKLLARGN